MQKAKTVAELLDGDQVTRIAIRRAIRVVVNRLDGKELVCLREKLKPVFERFEK